MQVSVKNIFHLFAGFIIGIVAIGCVWTIAELIIKAVGHILSRLWLSL